jgi:hypothetical protein
MPALIRIIGHYTDYGSLESETAVRSQQEQRLVDNKDVQPIEVINPFFRWHRRWYRSKITDCWGLLYTI